ncbi:ATP-dependent DNA helicase PcrA [Gimesia chilikensis]|uniref:DNA 3'-5' helicase n=1 Tax=Gimesia chilikensis TaxID=2605989 RepID=A0A517W590_9PLAN|nr:UvrD-helicase domain-containing protein [Gimesia chilikensis]QDU00425.1 ATP-dependent DNA helicase PcrA [Gimesia chilikensis]
MDFQQVLTPEQYAAVSHHQGPLLVLAGPGSGKTRVITHRIASLIQARVPANQILGITFTNKASDEMGERVQQLIPGIRVEISTFHKFCVRILRRYGRAVGLDSNFSIFDTSDQQQLIRYVLNELDIDTVAYNPSTMAGMISRAKNDLITAERYAEGFQESIGDHLQAVAARVYPVYQRLLLESNAVDFDDLLLHVASLLKGSPELRATLDERYQYILVDEYQDTNLAQYQIVMGLSLNTRNLCVTGDPDQSIYGWRGAKIENILQFERDFPDCQTIRLEQNFRSTKEILRVADSLIVHNQRRKAKTLFTENPEGTPVELLTYNDERQEAEEIALHIRRAVDRGEFEYTDFAIFYRVNSLSRELELALARHKIPYQLAGSVAFYERTEVKDLLAYLKLINNPDDRVAFGRIVNKPLRGIGKTTQRKLIRWADEKGISLLEAAHQAADCSTLSKRAATMVARFAKMISGFSLADTGSVAQLMEVVIDSTRMIDSWKESPDEDDQQRIANVNELVSTARKYDQIFGDETTLEGFLEVSTLASATDQLDAESGQVTLMTLHAAKGLEYPVVFIIGVEQNLIPHERVLREELRDGLEEERRLFFVGITRAEQCLYLTQTRERSLRGRPWRTITSDFLKEIDVEVKDMTDFLGEHRSHFDDFVESVKRGEVDTEALKAATPQKKPLLMTGADLLKQTPEAAELPQGFSVGMRVRHPRYGVGTVMGISGFARKRMVTVLFDEMEEGQTFVAAHCPLQPLGLR